MNCFIDTIRSKGSDAGVLTFNSVHPKWSFVNQNDDGIVTQAAEKRPISNNAIAGFYYFEQTKDFIEAAKNLIRKDVKFDGSFYVSETLNELILRGKKVLSLNIPKERYHHFHDEHSLDSFQSNRLKKSILNSTIYELTRGYIDAFNSMDIDKIKSYFSNDFSLRDPEVYIEGKEEVCSYIRSIFNSVQKLEFKAENIIVEKNKSVIEFILRIDNETFIGTDVIYWQDDKKMHKMNAYLFGAEDE
nr:nuclear transport factor 2 family protein [Marinifaba aquimaris]